MGAYVKMRLETVSNCDASILINDAAGVSSLLKHENRLTVLHFLVKRTTLGVGDTQPLPSKELVEVVCGHRRWRGRPIYSSHGPKSARALSSRFLRPGDHVVCSVLGPLTYAPAPVVLFRASGEACAIGSALTCDPDRIIFKDASLSGGRYEHINVATVYKMFENPEDCVYFKLKQKAARDEVPAPRATRTCPIARNGHFKACARFRPMSQADTSSSSCTTGLPEVRGWTTFSGWLVLIRVTFAVSGRATNAPAAYARMARPGWALVEGILGSSASP